MKQSHLLALTQEDIMTKELPLKELIENSAYYPSCWFDGGVIKHCNENLQDEGICSFIYCDYAPEEDDVVSRASTGIRGYHVFAHRTVGMEEIGAEEPLPIDFAISAYEESRLYDLIKNKPENLYCHWLVMERDADFGEEHGPERFSLLYIRGEGVATYAGLYCAHKVSPKVLGIIQPGHGFGGNWTNYSDPQACLYSFLRSNPAGMPSYVFYGGIGIDGYEDLNWPDYEIVDRVKNYYHRHYGHMVVYALQNS